MNKIEPALNSRRKISLKAGKIGQWKNKSFALMTSTLFHSEFRIERSLKIYSNSIGNLTRKNYVEDGFDFEDEIGNGRAGE